MDSQASLVHQGLADIQVFVEQAGSVDLVGLAVSREIQLQIQGTQGIPDRVDILDFQQPLRGQAGTLATVDRFLEHQDFQAFVVTAGSLDLGYPGSRGTQVAPVSPGFVERQVTLDFVDDQGTQAFAVSLGIQVSAVLDAAGSPGIPERGPAGSVAFQADPVSLDFPGEAGTAGFQR